MTETTEGPARALPPTFGPRPGTLRRTEINRQVEALVHRFTMRMSGLAVLAHGLLAEQVRLDGSLVMMLASEERMARAAGAELIGRHLLDVGEKTDPAFWSTDLGRAIAREIGWVDLLPPRAVAQAVLQVSRQAVFQMVDRGDLEGGTGKGVRRASLQQAAARRWPREADVE
jgi:hypothetical protein